LKKTVIFEARGPTRDRKSVFRGVLKYEPVHVFHVQILGLYQLQQ